MLEATGSSPAFADDAEEPKRQDDIFLAQLILLHRLFEQTPYAPRTVLIHRMASDIQLRQKRVTATTTDSGTPIALTTIFTPPPSCNNIVTYDGTTLWQNGVSQTGDPSCYPPSFSNILSSYFSPGLCPESWTSAGQISHSSGNDAMCCPDSYILSTSSAASLLNDFCFSLMTTALSNVYSVPSLTNGPIPPSPKLITLATAQVKSTTVYADVIQVRWRSSDQQVLNLMKQEKASSTHKSTASPGSRTTGVAAATSSSVTSSDTPAIGLSTGAKIGLGIGVSLGVVAIAAYVTFLLLRRRRQRRRIAGPVYEPKVFHELDPDYVGQSEPAELHAGEVLELSGTERRSEIDVKMPGV